MSKYKIYIGALLQETNTFTPKQTSLENYYSGYFFDGSEIYDNFVNTNTEIGGFCSVLMKETNIEIVPGLATWAVASGAITRTCIDFFLAKIISGITKAQPDGVLLALHGALVCQDIDDCEGYIIKGIRSILGEHIPIVCTLDFHASVTDDMVNGADILVGFRTYPHVDFSQTGSRAAGLLIKLLTCNERPQKIYKKLPLILPVENTETGVGPISTIMKKIIKADSDAAVYTGSIFIPHPWLDVNGFNIAILYYVAPVAAEKFEASAIDNLRFIWDRKAEFYHELPSISECMKDVERFEKPLILIDTGDIVTAGGIGDSTEILRTIIGNKIKLNVVLSIVDSNSVLRALRIGVGKTDTFTLGGENDYGYNKHVQINAKVCHISSEPVEVKGVSFGGIRFNVGTRVLLESDNIKLVLCEKSSLMHDANFLKSIGVELGKCDIIVQKSHKLFRSSYKDIAKTIISVETGGFTNRNICALPYKKIKRPIYPLDEIDDFAGRN